MTERELPIPPTDPHGLLLSGEPTATLAELAGRLDVSMNALRSVIHERSGGAVRYVRRFPSRDTLYAVADVHAAVEKHRGWIDERRRAAAELEASQRAAKAARTATNTATSNSRRDKPPPSWRKAPKPSAQAPSPERRPPSSPEVFVVRKGR